MEVNTKNLPQMYYACNLTLEPLSTNLLKIGLKSVFQKLNLEVFCASSSTNMCMSYLNINK